MVDGTAGCVWGWLRPRRVDGPDAGQAGCLAKAGTAARRRAGATIQACTVVASAIHPKSADEEAARPVDMRQREQELRSARVGELGPLLAEGHDPEPARVDDRLVLLGVDRADGVDERPT